MYPAAAALLVCIIPIESSDAITRIAAMDRDDIPILFAFLDILLFLLLHADTLFLTYVRNYVELASQTIHR